MVLNNEIKKELAQYGVYGETTLNKVKEEMCYLVENGVGGNLIEKAVYNVVNMEG